MTDKVKRAVAAVRRRYDIRGAFTKADFYRICEAENIRLIKSDIFYRRIKQIKGFILTVSGRKMIYLRSFHQSRFDIKTACHELGHYFLRHGGINFKQMREDDVFADEQIEKEADWFAELATKREGKSDD